MAEDIATEPDGYDPNGQPVRWRSFYDEATNRLRVAGFASPEVDARRIVEQASGHEGSTFHAGLDEFATTRGVAAFDRMVERRLAGEPLQYVVGAWGFRTLDLMVDRRVLIPRPETEIVAGVALDELERVADGSRELVAVDLGTGSGAIGLSIAVERPDTTVLLTDVSDEALQVARANLAGIGRAGARVTIGQGSWYRAVPGDLRGAIDVIVSNPPYVAETDDLPDEVCDWEPAEALFSADHGRADLRVVIEGAGEWLRPGGAVVVEMAPTQTAWAHALATEVGLVDVEVVADLAGRDRVVRARCPN